jgi:RND family efflux transporter MFP subunit
MVDDAEAPPERPRRKHTWLAMIIAGALLVAAFLFGLLPRLANRRTVREETVHLAIPTVAVISPQRAAPTQELVLPGNVQPFTSAPIFARTNGYLKAWYKDIGTYVKAGELLAVIETPEVDQQLQNARANLRVAEANLATSEATAKRFTELQHTNAVSKLEVDNAVGAARANRATVEANRASVRQLEQQKGFSNITAPFAGVITERNTDVGDLIDAGSSTGPQTALFRIARTNKLRVYVRMPEPYAPAAQLGLPATLTVAGMPGRTFTGKLVRTANAIDPATRTLLVEVEVNNPTGTLFSGAFAEVTFALPSVHDVFILPVETLLFRGEGLRVATVRGDHVVLKRITPGRDFGDRIEIVEGLTADDRVIVSPGDSIADGDEVNVTQARSTQRAER